MIEAPPLVYVVDDDTAFREAIDSLLRSNGYESLGFESVDEFSKHKRAANPSCLLLDIRMPGRSPLEFQRELHESRDAIPVIFITGHGDVPMSVRAMKDGAVSFLLKPFQEQDLLDAIRDGLDQDRLRRQDQQSIADVEACVSSLSYREREILIHVCKGQTNREIAKELGLQEITIKVHRANAMRKMKTRFVAELVTKFQSVDLFPAKASR